MTKLYPSMMPAGSFSRGKMYSGTVVSVPRTYVNHVVTEYGVVDLLGRSQRERAERLISIAHPDFRNDLRREAKRLF